MRYSVRRQEQQDAIIRKMLRESAAACFANQAGTGPRPLKQEVMTRWRGRHGLPAPAQPWAVFTAGCMGAGKTHVMQLLDKHGLLPLRSFVRIDLDRIRAQLPETKTYMRAPAPPAPQPASTHAGPTAHSASRAALPAHRARWRRRARRAQQADGRAAHAARGGRDRRDRDGGGGGLLHSSSSSHYPVLLHPFSLATSSLATSSLTTPPLFTRPSRRVCTCG